MKITKIYRSKNGEKLFSVLLEGEDIKTYSNFLEKIETAVNKGAKRKGEFNKIELRKQLGELTPREAMDEKRKLMGKILDKKFSEKKKSFQKFKRENENTHGLPFGFRDSRGAFVDGRIKAETEKEYNSKARKMIKDHEESLKSFSEKTKKRKFMDKLKEASLAARSYQKHSQNDINHLLIHQQHMNDAINAHNIANAAAINAHGIASGIGPIM